jgi:hypothetical protein
LLVRIIVDSVDFGKEEAFVVVISLFHLGRHLCGRHSDVCVCVSDSTGRRGGGEGTGEKKSKTKIFFCASKISRETERGFGRAARFFLVRKPDVVWRRLFMLW